MMNYRDAIFRQLSANQKLVTGCDSCGAIGLKGNDILEVPPEVVGLITARVAILEVLTLGAGIVGVSVPISNEPDTTGIRLLNGVKECLDDFNIDTPVLTSMEKNMKTSMTAMGVVVNGIADELKLNKFEYGDEIYVFGRPSVGHEVLEHADELLNARTVMELIGMDQVKEILPVGSKGILKELNSMFEYHGTKYEMTLDPELDIHKSCGPASVAIVVAKKNTRFDVNIPKIRIGVVL